MNARRRRARRGARSTGDRRGEGVRDLELKGLTVGAQMFMYDAIATRHEQDLDADQLLAAALTTVGGPFAPQTVHQIPDDRDVDRKNDDLHRRDALDELVELERDE